MLRPIGSTLVAGLLAAWGCTSLAGIDEFQVGGGSTATGGSGAIGGSGGGTGGGGTGGNGACDTPSDCPGDDTTCQQRTCDDQVCGTAFAEANFPCDEGGEVCNGEGACVWSAGHECGSGDECLDGYCQDGVCCDAPCVGTCQACAHAKTGLADGICGPIAAFDDPDTECSDPPSFGCDGVDGCASCATSAPIVGTCPGECTGGCQGDWCEFDCAGDSTCDGGTIDCPVGWNCRLICPDHHSCRDAVVHCAEGYACEVVCGNDDHQCQALALHCPAHGPCTMDCNGGQACDGAVITCGESDCVATCEPGNAPALNSCPDGGCACTECT